MKLTRMFCMMALSVVALTGLAQASDLKPADLSEWKGRYVNIQSFMSTPEFGTFLDKLVEEAKKQGKEATADLFKAKFQEQYYADSTAMSFDGDKVTYEKADGSKVEVEYRFAGYLDTDGYLLPVFSAKKVNGLSAQYKTLMLTALHGHGDGPKHFHFRYGMASPSDMMTDSDLASWWPTCVPESVTAQQYVDSNMAHLDKFVEYLLK